MDKPKVIDYVKEGEKGFKFDYSKLKKAVMKCEANDSKEDCKKIFKELNIDLID